MWNSYIDYADQLFKTLTSFHTTNGADVISWIKEQTYKTTTLLRLLRWRKE